jgi:hypothetical protein
VDKAGRRGGERAGMRRMDIGERRARLGRRHRLAPGTAAADPVAAARSLVALHATDPASVYLSAAARMRAPDPGAVASALYEERTLLRMLGMRRTMFVVPVELAPVVQAACTRAVAEKERRRLVARLEGAGIATDAGRWLVEVEDAVVRALAARGEAVATELSADVPALRERVLMAEGKSYEAWQNVSTWVLMLLSADGRIVRGRPRGSWISSQYRWAVLDDWLPQGREEWAPEQAEEELVRRWLRAFGPATPADLRWWTGWTMGRTRAALARVGPAEVDLDGEAGLVLPDDLEPEPPPDPWVALLPALDATPMGWAGRDWFLGDHREALFDRSGNIGPTIWCDGRVVGGWAQRADGEIAIRLREDVGAGARAGIDAAAEGMAAWIGDIRFTPRFRTPLERELSS